ncbi:MAG: ribosome biogenesis GTP-binding protein YihA/YsxC [bacterium]
MLKIPSATYVTSRADLKTLVRPSLPEIAFAGRSNVGKSSLINSLLNRRKLALVSKRPGKTQLLNYFLVDNRYYFVDLPGYGFARVPKALRQKWGVLVEGYLRESTELRCVIVILDSRHGATPDDHELLHWLQMYRRPFVIALTKSDKLSRTESQKVLERLRDELQHYAPLSILAYSSAEHSGREELWNEILEVLKN